MRQPLDYYRVRCKCDKCGTTAVVKINEIVGGKVRCFMQRIGKPPCDGTLNYYAQDYSDATCNAVAILGYLNETVMRDHKNDYLTELVDAVADDVGHWMEGEQTPQQMGWVNDKGLP